jgi:hypothetical protein
MHGAGEGLDQRALVERNAVAQQVHILFRREDILR